MDWHNKRGKTARRSKPTNSSFTGRLSAARTQPVLAVALSLILALGFISLVIIPLIQAADPGHAAESISAGTFESGNYSFPKNVTVADFFIANGTTLYVDALNGRVGIGTTAPQQTLDVVGTVNATDFKCDSTGCINAAELNADAAGDGLKSSSGVLTLNMTPGGGLVTTSDSISLNRSCSSNEILKWSGSNWECSADTAYNSSYTTTTYNATYHTTSNVVTGNYSVLEASKGNYTTWQAVVGNWSNWATTYNATYHNPVQSVIGNYSALQTVPGNYSTIQAVIGNWSNWAATYNATYHTTSSVVEGNYSRWANQTATDVECADCVDGAELADSIALDANLAITGYNVTFDTDTLHVNANDDRVGVGTTMPSKKLEVSNSTQSITFDPNVTSPTINTTASTNLTITSSGGNVIIQLG